MNKHVGSSFDDFLVDEYLFHETQAHAIKKVLAWQIHQEMEERRISKSKMAGRMKTSRSALDRLLDQDDASVTLSTMAKAAEALGMHIEMNLVPNDKHEPEPA